MKIVEVGFRIGRGDGEWANYRVERILKMDLPYGQKELGDKELKEIKQYATMLANREQAIIRCEFEDGKVLIYDPTKWKKR